MGLDDIRLLEDLKASRGSLYEEYSQMVGGEKENSLKQTIEEFSEFFSQAKFNVQLSPNLVTAKYGGSSVALDFTNSFGYAGFSIRMELTVSLAAHKPQKLILGFNRHLPEVHASVQSSKQQTISEEIAMVKAEIESLENKIKNPTSSSFKLFVRPEDQAGEFKAYNSLTDLLSEITS